MENKDLLDWINKEVGIFQEDEYDDNYMSPKQIKKATELLENLKDKNEILNASIKECENKRKEIIETTKKIVKHSEDYEFIEMAGNYEDMIINIKKPTIMICNNVMLMNCTLINNKNLKKL